MALGVDMAALMELTSKNGWVRLVDVARIAYASRYISGGVWPEKTTYGIHLWLDVGEPFKVDLEFDTPAEADAAMEKIKEAKT